MGEDVEKIKGLTILELLIVMIIIGGIFLIAAPNLLGLADKAKMAVVKTNMVSAASSVKAKLILGDMDADTAAQESVEELQNAGTPDNQEDDPKNPFAVSECSSQDCPAFQYGSGGDNYGAVIIGSDENNEVVRISAFGKNGKALFAKKTVTPAELGNSENSNMNDNSIQNSNNPLQEGINNEVQNFSDEDLPLT